ncbi:MAG: hypothetical protein IVW56_04620 [Candidatus Binataceae bacterium]|nr:hypothetical protein [Candidatus Binataceae bacterium]
MADVCADTTGNGAAAHRQRPVCAPRQEGMDMHCEHGIDASECRRCEVLHRRTTERAVRTTRARRAAARAIGALVDRIMRRRRAVEDRGRRAALARIEASPISAETIAEVARAVAQALAGEAIAARPAVRTSDSLALACACGDWRHFVAADLDFADVLRASRDEGWTDFGARLATEQEIFGVAAMNDARGGLRASVNARCPKCTRDLAAGRGGAAR